MELIEEFARPVLRESPEQGLAIFTDDLQEVEALPRPRVYEYLRRTAPQLLPQYLVRHPPVPTETALKPRERRLVACRSCSDHKNNTSSSATEGFVDEIK